MIVRRSFITLLGGAAVGWPFVARGQQPAIIAYLSHGTPEGTAAFVAAVCKGQGDQITHDGIPPGFQAPPLKGSLSRAP
jgi:hypothetical protein